jgi:hypothetical protein
MITIAGGIILAVLFFAVLPYLIAAVGLAIVIGLTAALLGTVSLLLWSWGQSDPTSLGIMCMLVGSVLVLNRLFAGKPPVSNPVQRQAGLNEDEFRRKYPYLSAKLDEQRARRAGR